VSDITEITRISRKPNLLDANVDGEVVALDIEAGDCYGFNVVASAIWGHLAKETTIEEICERLLAEFDVSEADCQKEVRDLVSRLEQDDLIVVHGP
jgi:hypothetical protein